MPRFGLNGSSRKSRTMIARRIAEVRPSLVLLRDHRPGIDVERLVDREFVLEGQGWTVRRPPPGSPAISAAFRREKLGRSWNRWEAVSTPSHFVPVPQDVRLAQLHLVVLFLLADHRPGRRRSSRGRRCSSPSRTPIPARRSRSRTRPRTRGPGTAPPRRRSRGPPPPRRAS